MPLPWATSLTCPASKVVPSGCGCWSVPMIGAPLSHRPILRTSCGMISAPSGVVEVVTIGPFMHRDPMTTCAGCIGMVHPAAASPPAVTGRPGAGGGQAIGASWPGCTAKVVLGRGAAAGSCDCEPRPITGAGSNGVALPVRRYTGTAVTITLSR